MKKFIIACVAAISLSAMVGCSDDNRQYSSTTTSESSSVDTKEMHHRSQ